MLHAPPPIERSKGRLPGELLPVGSTREYQDAAEDAAEVMQVLQKRSDSPESPGSQDSSIEKITSLFQRLQDEQDRLRIRVTTMEDVFLKYVLGRFKKDFFKCEQALRALLQI